MVQSGLWILGYLFFVVCVPAEPTEKLPIVNLQITNDLTSSYASQSIPSDGRQYPVNIYWAGTALSYNGQIFATSAQLIAFQQNTLCDIQFRNKDIQLGPKKTWVSLAEGLAVDLQDALVSCREER